MSILSQAVTHYRSTFCILALVLIAGFLSYQDMTIETEPEVQVPYVVVSVLLDGVSPEDGARLLARPIEQELQSLENVAEIKSTSRESVTTVLVKFEAGGIDINKAVSDVRTAIDRAKEELPDATEEPVVEEVSAADFPAITVSLGAQNGVSERVVYQTAQMLKRRIEGLSDVLEVTLAGHREEVVEAIINPSRLENYNITSTDLVNAIVGNNLLVPAGELDTGMGRFSIKVPGLIESYRDVYEIPIKSTPQGVVTLGDVTDIRRTFKDPKTFTNVNGSKAILIEVTKRHGSNQIEVSEAVRKITQDESHRIPPGVNVGFQFDQSVFSKSMVTEMTGNIVTALVLVMIIVVAALGFRSGTLVGFGIPFSLMTAIIVLNYLDFSFNFIVMFGMILALGMLIDGSVVITEFADRKMAEGLSSRAAYQIAVKRMRWPVIASAATTLAAFLPLMFWPGVPGDFMGYLPVTVFWVLVASLLYALFFSAVIGSLMGKSKMDPKVQHYLRSLETDPPTELSGITGRYARLLERVLRRPLRFIAASLVVLVGIFALYVQYNNGVLFFADTEEKYGSVSVRAMGNLSVQEKKTLLMEVEQLVLQEHGVLTAYTSGGGSPGYRSGSAKDEIGLIMVELDEPSSIGYSTKIVFENIRESTKNIPGIKVSPKPFDGGPVPGKPIQIQLESIDRDKLLKTARHVRHLIEENISGLRDITDTTPLPGIEWEMEVDRALAAQAGVNVIEVGRAVQLITNGVKVGDYRPDDANDEIEIRVRYPVGERGLKVLDNLRVTTPNGPVPIGGFVTRTPKPAVDVVNRIDGIEVVTIRADVAPGILADDKVKEVLQLLEALPQNKDVSVKFRGADEEQQKTLEFLKMAFLLSLALMFILLVTQFNSFYQGALILSAVIMSTAGVLLGLLVTERTFSMIFTGVGIVALAGIVVNNNIVLIDTYNYIRKDNPDLSVKDTVVLACTQRLRPVFLTTATTILGMLPIAMGVSIDMLGRTIVVDGVITSVFQSLANAIVSGLMFSTLLTLFLTPALLVMPGRFLHLYERHVRPYLKPLLNRLPAQDKQTP